MGGSGTDDGTVGVQVIAVVERVHPSGAMIYRFEADAAEVEPDLRRAISVIDDGPLHLTAMVTVQRADGEPFENPQPDDVVPVRCDQLQAAMRRIAPQHRLSTTGRTRHLTWRSRSPAGSATTHPY